MKKYALILFALLPAALLLFGLRIKEGCGEELMCMGPGGDYWTIWQAQLAFQHSALILAMIASFPVIIFGCLRKWKMASIVVTAIGLFLWVLLYGVIFTPTIIHY